MVKIHVWITDCLFLLPNGKNTAWKTKAKCQKGEKRPTIIFKLLKLENTDAVTMKKSANSEQKKLLYVCRTLAKPCCCMGSFLKGIFGINLICDGLLRLTLMCVHAGGCVREQAIEDAKKAEK